MAVMYTIEPLLGRVYVSRGVKAAEGVLTAVRMEVFRVLLMQPVAFFDRRGATEITNVLAVDLETVRASVFGCAPTHLHARSRINPAPDRPALPAWIPDPLSACCHTQHLLSALCPPPGTRHTAPTRPSTAHQACICTLPLLHSTQHSARPSSWGCRRLVRLTPRQRCRSISRDRGLRAVMEATGSVCVLFCLSWHLAPVLATVIVGTAIAATVYRKVAKGIEARLSAALRCLSRVAGQAFSNIRTVRAFAGARTPPPPPQTRARALTGATGTVRTPFLSARRP